MDKIDSVSTVVITDANGIRVIDMSPVEEFEAAVDAGDISRELQILHELNAEQLRFALCVFVGRWKNEHSIVKFLHTKKGRESLNDICKFQSLVKEAGFDIWPDWPMS